MTSYEKLLEMHQKIQNEINAARAAVIAEIRQQMVDLGITLADLERIKAGRELPHTGSRSKPPKYRDPETGRTWSGKGRPPEWIIGKKRELYLIANATHTD